MFDIINPKKEYIPYDKTVTVNERRAPTDESIRLLNEMQEKVIANVLQKINVSNNIFSGSIVIWKDQRKPFSMQYTLKFKLNEEEYSITKEMDGGERLYASDQVESLFELFVKDIATTILHNSIKQTSYVI